MRILPLDICRVLCNYSNVLEFKRRYFITVNRINLTSVMYFGGFSFWYFFQRLKFLWLT